MYRSLMKAPVCVINIEETIGKTVGRRRPPSDPFQIADSIQRTLTDLHKASGHRYGARGVFRFKTHAEANEWTKKMTRPKKS